MRLTRMPFAQSSVSTLGVLIAALPVFGNAAADDTAITIYSSQQPGAIPAELYRPVPGAAVPSAGSVPGYALVRQDRDIKLQGARATVRIADVAALIDPTTVTFASLSDPQTRVLEQSYQFDLVSTDKLLLRYIDRPIAVERQSGERTETVNGTLLSSSSGEGLVLRTSDGSIDAIRSYSGVRFPEIPGGLDTRPTLVWDIVAPHAGDQRSRITYQTGGMTWWADYNLIYKESGDPNTGLLDLSAWVSIINQSGASYTDARLKLVAGDVHRVMPVVERKAWNEAPAPAPQSALLGGFQEQPFFEFHLYTLERRTSLPNNSTKQIELFSQARQVPARKLLLYAGAPNSYYGGPATDRNYGSQSKGKVDVYLEFRNDKQSGLGAPLPAGRIRVSKLDAADGSLEFIGEDRIDHTPRDEPVRIKLGSAFDVVAERRQTDFSVNANAHWLEEQIEIKLRNHKEESVHVLVQERLYRWSNWQILTQSNPYTREDARTIVFPVDIPKNGEQTVTYKVRYAW